MSAFRALPTRSHDPTPPARPPRPNGVLVFLSVLGLALGAPGISAQECPPYVLNLSKNNEVYLYFPSQQATMPELGMYDWSPIDRFTTERIPGISNGDGLRQAIHEIVAGHFCEFDIQVISTRDRPTPTGENWQIVAIATDTFPQAASVVFGEAVFHPSDPQTWSRMWVREFVEKFGDPGGALQGSNSTRERWAHAIAHTATHEAGHNYRLVHNNARPRQAEDGMTNHVMVDGKVLASLPNNQQGEIRATRPFHFSDTNYEILAHDVGLNVRTLHNWDLVNPNSTAAYGLVFHVLSQADELTLAWFYRGIHNPWGEPAIAPTGGTVELRGTIYNEFELRYDVPKEWTGGPDGVVPAGIEFHTGASFVEPEAVVVDSVYLLRQDTTALPLRPRMAGYDAGLIDAQSGAMALTFFNTTGGSPLTVENLTVRALPRQADIESMVEGAALRDIHAVAVEERTLPGYEPTSALALEDSTTIRIARMTDSRFVDVDLAAVGCPPTNVPPAGAFDGDDEADYCKEGTALSLFPSTVVYVTATIVDPEAEHFDAELGQMVTGPLESRLYYQFVGVVPDFNENGTDDLLDIRGGTSQDFNRNGLPDEVEPRRVAVSAHGGLISPMGSLGNSTSAGPTATVDLTYPFSPRIHADLRAGFSRLGGKAGLPDRDIWSVAANAKLLQPLAGGFRGFLNGGLGAYIVDGSTEGGVNAGVGFARSVATDLYAEVTFDMTWTFTMPTDVRFARTQAGFVWMP